jgi:hypothetical protein
MIEVKIDSRVCVKRTEEGFKIDRQDISIPDTVEVLERILMFLRMEEFGALTAKVLNVIDSFEHYPEIETGETVEYPKVCIAYDYVTHRIQFAVIGLVDLWDACLLLNAAKNYLNALMMGLITE